MIDVLLSALSDAATLQVGAGSGGWGTDCHAGCVAQARHSVRPGPHSASTPDPRASGCLVRGCHDGSQSQEPLLPQG